MNKTVLGIKIDDIPIDQVVEVVEKWLSKPGKHYVLPKAKGKALRSKHYIVTPNPEIIVMAQKDTELKTILNKADLAIPDGFGLKLSGDIECISPGIDVMEELIKLSSEKGFTTAFLGGRNGVAEKCAERLKEKYPNLRVRYALEGPVIPAKAGIYTDKDLWIPDQVRDDKVDILFVAFGPPKQEKWIAKNLEKLDIKIALGVGGAFDVLSGIIPRAPEWMRDLGLEWLFRLVIEPWRIKRQMALLKYLWLILRR